MSNPLRGVFGQSSGWADMKSPGCPILLYGSKDFLRKVVELMCTSFVYRDQTVLVGMNFDNNGKECKLVFKDGNQFVVMVHVNGTFYPSFGVNRNGTFINDQLVDSNGEGAYKRQNENRWVTTNLIGKVLTEEIPFASLQEVLRQKTIVNTPNTSTHCMIADRLGHVHIVEPGRRNLFSPATESPFYLMTNFPLAEYQPMRPDEVRGSGADRFQTAYRRLSECQGTLDVDAGFAILEAVKQEKGEWMTEFSMISVPAERVVYFSLNGDFQKRLKFSFADSQIKTAKGFAEDICLVLTGKGITKPELENYFAG